MVDHVAMRWENLGYMLLEDEHSSHIENIRKSNNDSTECCKRMFWLWLDIDPTANWKDLIKTLRLKSVGLPVVADDLEKKLKGM